MTFGLIILNIENIFCNFKELHCRLLVLVLMIVVMILFFDNTWFVQRNRKQMVLKILMCRCYKEEFLENGYEYKKKIIHFHCYCDDEHSSYYVLFFKEHPYGAAFGRFAPRGESCQCKKCHDHQICTFCFLVR